MNIFVILFKVLLANKLDEDISLSYIGVVSPLFLSYCTLILMSFGAKGGNRCKYITVYIVWPESSCLLFIQSMRILWINFPAAELIEGFPLPFQML
jgi:hypothetical protein